MENPQARQLTERTGILYRPLVHALLIAGLACLAYANTFQVPFLLDDLNEILENPIVHSFDFFRDPSAARAMPSYHGLQMRPVGYFTLALNYRLGGTDVTGYHVFNLVVHILAALLVYRLVYRVLQLSFGGRTGTPESAPFVALAVAVIFSVHPIQTEAVTYVIQRLTSLAACFSLLGLTSYIEGRLQTVDKSTGKALAWYLLALAATVAAMKTKEITFTLPVVIALLEILFFREKLWRRLVFLGPFLLTMLIIPLSLIGATKPLGEIISNVGDVSRVDHAVTRSQYLFTQFRVIVSYLRLLVFPAGQNLDHGHPLHPEFFAPEVFLSFLFLGALFAFGVFCLWASRPAATPSLRPGGNLPGSRVPELRLIGFGILWFFITLSVESSVIPITDVMVEHRLYLPSVGIFLALVTAGWWLARKLRKQRAAAALAVVVVLILTGASFARNSLWQDQLRMWHDVVSKSPRNARGYNNLAAYYDDRGDYAKAVEYFQKALAINPNQPETLFGIGISYASLKEQDQAIYYYRRALALRPGDPKIHYNLGVSYMTKGLMAPAAESFMEAVRLDPDMQQARMFLEYTRGQMRQLNR